MGPLSDFRPAAPSRAGPFPRPVLDATCNVQWESYPVWDARLIGHVVQQYWVRGAVVVLYHLYYSAAPSSVTVLEDKMLAPLGLGVLLQLTLATPGLRTKPVKLKSRLQTIWSKCLQYVLSWNCHPPLSFCSALAEKLWKLTRHHKIIHISCTVNMWPSWIACHWLCSPRSILWQNPDVSFGWNWILHCVLLCLALISAWWPKWLHMIWHYLLNMRKLAKRPEPARFPQLLQPTCWFLPGSFPYL